MQRRGNFFLSSLDFVLPKRCPPCGVIVHGDGAFCASCWGQMYFLAPPWCRTCALPMPSESFEDQQCAQCMLEPPHHDGIRAVTAYDEVSRQIPLKLKYGGKIGLAGLIANQMMRHLPDGVDDIIITPVPLHWSRLWSRGYNQSALIAQALARQSGLKYIPDLLIRKKRTPLLRGMSGKQRKNTVGNVFAVHPKRADIVKSARVIIIDDVLTTGATSNACIKQLKRGGADWVQLFCWARVLRGEAAEERNTNGLDSYLLDA
jgi:ComF family protein